MADTYRLNHGLVELVTDDVPTGVFIDTPVVFDPPNAVAVPDSPVTFTQTYSTVATTVPNATYAATATVGDSDNTELIADVVALAADVLALKKVLGKVIDVLQAAELAA